MSHNSSLLFTMTRTITLALALFAILALASASDPATNKLRGVRSRYAARYSGPSFTCFDGSKTISLDFVNDDFCDCADGSDEPGTSACPTATFFCRNKGAKSSTVPSSRVNDGVCDCCDGSDEWRTGACSDTCAEQGKLLTAGLEQEISNIEAGSKVREQLIADAAKQAEERRAKQAKFEKLLEERRAVMEAAKAKKEAEEELERKEQEKRDAEHAAAEAAKAPAAGENATVAATPDAAAAPAATEAAAPTPATPAAADSAAPAAATPAAEQANAFPYPAEYAPKPAATEAAPAQENFPYPAEYAPKAGGDDHAEGDHEHEGESEHEGDEHEGEHEGHEGEAEGEHEHEDSHDEHAHEEQSTGTATDSGSTGAAKFESEGTTQATNAATPATASTTAAKKKRRRRRRSSKSKATPAVTTPATTSTTPITTISVAPADSLPAPRSGVCSSMHNFWPLLGSLCDTFAIPFSYTPSFVTHSVSYTSSLIYNITQGPPRSAAQKAREEFQKAETRFNKIQKRLEEVKKLLSHDYGTDGQFSSLQGQCFNIVVKQYTYEFCPYEDAKQKEGHSSTSLGRWQGVETDAEGTQVFKFTGGQSCWNGPQRSAAVKLQCGTENKILTVEEPSKCVYELLFSTPTVCHAAHAQALRLNLEASLSGEDEE